MNSMKKKLLIAFGATATLAFASIIVYQTDVIATLTKNLKSESRRADVAEQELLVKNALVEELSTENAQLRDSIEGLYLEIAKLNETIAEQKKAIKKLNSVLKSQEDKVAELTREIAALEKSGVNNRQKISQLEKERHNLLIKMEEYDRYRQSVIEQQAIAERKKDEENRKLDSAKEELEENVSTEAKPVVEAPPVNLNVSPSEAPSNESAAPSPALENIKNKQQENLVAIKTQTSVRFSDITLRKKETGNDLKKIDAKDWRYTFIEFDLDNPKKDLILNEIFVLQIFDIDQNQVVPMNEANPEFPDGETGRTGYRFRYKGAPVSIRYFNNQRKEGANYELRLYYLKGGLFFPLDNGSKRIVQDGQVLTR